MKQCKHCGGEFDPQEKVRQAKQNRLPMGKIDECLDCVETDVERHTGVMISGLKTGGTIQINTDPRLTEYMLQSSPSNRTARVMKMTAPPPKVHAAVQVHVTELEKRR